MKPRTALGLLMLLVFAAALSGCAGLASRAPVGHAATLSGGRLFREVSPLGAGDLLRMNVPAVVRWVEISPDGQAISDTLDVWVQHCAPKCVVPAEVMVAADLVLSCYPNGAALWVRLMHVLPGASGEIWLYDMGAFVYVSPGREPLYDVLARARGWQPVRL